MIQTAQTFKSDGLFLAMPYTELSKGVVLPDLKSARGYVVLSGVGKFLYRSNNRDKVLRAALTYAKRTGVDTQIGEIIGISAGRPVCKRAVVVAVDKVKNPLKVNEFLRRVDSAAKKAKSITDPMVVNTVNRALDDLVRKPWNRMSDAEVTAAVNSANRTLDKLSKKWPKATLDKFEKNFTVTSTSVVRDTRRVQRTVHNLDIGINLLQSDQVAVEHMVKNQSLFARNRYKDISTAASKKARRIVSEGLAAGLGPDDIAKDLRKGIGPMYSAVQKNYYRTLAHVFVGRSRAWAQGTSYKDAGITRYRVSAVLDEVTTDTCRAMNGRILPVRESLAIQRNAMELEKPEDIKYEQPFMSERKGEIGIFDADGNWDSLFQVRESGLGTQDVGRYRSMVSNADLIDKGIGFPPYHFHCRTITLPE